MLYVSNGTSPPQHISMLSVTAPWHELGVPDEMAFLNCMEVLRRKFVSDRCSSQRVSTSQIDKKWDDRLLKQFKQIHLIALQDVGR